MWSTGVPPAFRSTSPIERGSDAHRWLVPAVAAILVFVLTLGLIGSESSLTAAGAAPPARAGIATWTILVYVAADNDLEAAALDDLREIASVGSSGQLKIAVQLDRIAALEAWDSTAAGNWDGTKRMLIPPGMSLDDWSSAEDLGELNTGDPQALADFITWG